MGHRSGHEPHKWEVLPEKPFSHSLMGRCAALQGSLSMHKNDGLNAAAVCVSCLLLGSVIAVPACCASNAWGMEPKPRNLVG